MPYMTNLKPALIRFGLGPYLEEVPGWETRGSSVFNPACTIGHHTAGPLSGDRPSLNICVNGRTGLPGPLCNDFLSRSKVVLVAAGRANHAGTGGFRGLVGNSAAFGNEAESTGVLRNGQADWSEFQRWAFPRVHAAHLWLLGRDASWYAGHRDWTSRKIDPTAIETAALRHEIATLLANPGLAPVPPEEDLDATQAAQLRAVERMTQIIARQMGIDYTLGGANHGKENVVGWSQLGGRTLVDAIAWLMKEDDKPVDTEQVAEAIAASVANKLDGLVGASKEEVAEAVRSVFADAGTA